MKKFFQIGVLIFWIVGCILLPLRVIEVIQLDWVYVLFPLWGWIPFALMVALCEALVDKIMEGSNEGELH